MGALKEAGRLGLAPTTSTTAMLVLGDALAMCVVELKGFSREEFAFFHSGGSLGRSLTPVSQLMRQGEMHCIVEESATAREVLRCISATKGRPGAATIIDKDGRLLGIFTDGDFRRCLAEEIDFLELPIAKVATRTPKTIHQDEIAAEALRILSAHKIDQVIVVDSDRRPVGLIDIQDLIEVRLLPIGEEP